MPYPRPPTTRAARQAEARRPPPLIEIIFEGNRSLSFDSEDHYMLYIGALARRHELAERERRANANGIPAGGSAIPTTASPLSLGTALPIAPTTTMTVRTSPALTELRLVACDSSPTSSSDPTAINDLPITAGRSNTIDYTNVHGPPTTISNVDTRTLRADNGATGKRVPVEIINVDAPSQTTDVDLESILTDESADRSMETEDAVSGPPSPRILRPRRSLRLSGRGEECMHNENIHIYSSR